MIRKALSPRVGTACLLPQNVGELVLGCIGPDFRVFLFSLSRSSEIYKGFTIRADVVALREVLV